MCDLASKLPLLIGKLLDQEAHLKRGSFREETMTDIITGSLAAFAGPNLVIRYPVEVKTGGDIDLDFWHIKSGDYIKVRIQAKRLNAKNDGKPNQVKLKNRAYKELLHRPLTGVDYQFRTLINAPSSTIPLYMFYNHQSVVDDPSFHNGNPKVYGINLAFATNVAHELEDKLRHAALTPPKIKHHKRLSHLRKYFFGIEALLCPKGDWEDENVPTPSLVLTSLTSQYQRQSIGWSDEDVARHWLLERPINLKGHKDFLKLYDGPAIQITETVKIPTITFITGRPDTEISAEWQNYEGKSKWANKSSAV